MKTRNLKTAGAAILVGSLIAFISQAQAGGTVNFGNNSSNRVINGHTAAPITAANNVKVALYWSPLGSNVFVQLGAPASLGTPAAGIFVGGTRITGSSTPGGTSAKFQVRAWSGGAATHEQALLQPGVLIGQSAVFINNTGDSNGTPPAPPESLLAGGLTGFALTSNNVSSQPPTISCVTNKTVACGSGWSFDPPTATDGCTGANLTASVLSTITNGLCPQTATRTWSVTNSCNTNFATCSQTVTIVDAVAPVTTCASNKTVVCGTTWTFDPPSSSDACNTNTIIVLSTITNATCGNTFTAIRTWQSTDACGNTAQCSQTVSVVDLVAPVITCVSNRTVECGTPWIFDSPTATDACNTNSITVVGTITNAACGNTFSATRTWQCADACGNTAQCSQTISVLDTLAPTIFCASNKVVECGQPWTFDAPTATDECTTNSITVAGTITNGACGNAFTATRTWSATDACGNTAQCSQTVGVVDTTAPVISCSSNKVVSCTNDWDFDQPVASDACGGTSVVVLDTVTNTLCPLVLTRTWAITNACDTNLVTCNQTVTVLCPSCPVLQLTKACPAYPVPPGGTLVWTGTVTNASDIIVSNVVVMNDQPAANTLVFGPVTLVPGEGASFAGSYSVPASSGPHTDTLLATGLGSDGIVFTGSATASCAGTNHITPGDMNGDGIVDQAELNAVLSNYWPHSQWISMTNATLSCDGKFQFELTNASAWNFTVLASTNLVDWTNLPAPAFPVFQFLDPEGTNAPQRLYRLQWP